MINYKNIDEYIKTFPADIQSKLQEIRNLTKKLAPTAVETISYGMPTFKLNGKNLIHFAGYKTHIGFYPTPSALVAFEKELSVYKTSKGTAQFKLDEDLPIKLIEKMILYRIKENIKLQG
jgi:uncharacterized protein YdhG (YjbR/CyaY superfamily)